MLVRDAMTRNPITVTPDTRLPEIDSLMREHRIRRVPVVEGGRLVGIISLGDVIATMPSASSTLSRWEASTLLDKLQARDFMTSPVYATTPECALEEVANFLLEKKIGALPVLDGEALTGIVTESDIFRVFVDMLSGGAEVPGLRFELRGGRQRAVVVKVSQLVYEHGGRIVTIATVNEADGEHKRILVKEEGADAERLTEALWASDVEVLDVRQRQQPNICIVS